MSLYIYHLPISWNKTWYIVSAMYGLASVIFVVIVVSVLVVLVALTHPPLPLLRFPRSMVTFVPCTPLPHPLWICYRDSFCGSVGVVCKLLHVDHSRSECPEGGLTL